MVIEIRLATGYSRGRGEAREQREHGSLWGAGNIPFPDLGATRERVCFVKIQSCAVMCALLCNILAFKSTDQRRSYCIEHIEGDSSD